MGGGVFHSVANWHKIFDKLAADQRRQPQTFSPADLAGLKLASLRDRSLKNEY